MAAIEELFRTHLAGTTAVSALVSGRIYPMRALQGASTPYIVYQTISNVETMTKPSVSTLRLKRARIQVDGYTKGTSAYSACKSLQAAITASAYAFTSDVNGAIVETRIADTVDAQEVDEGFYRVSIDVSILYNE